MGFSSSTTTSHPSWWAAHTNALVDKREREIERVWRRWRRSVSVLYSSFHFLKIFSFDLNGRGIQGISNRRQRAKPKIFNTTRTTHQKSRSTLTRLRFYAPPFLFLNFYLLNFRVSFQSATVENSRREKIKKWRKPAFLRLVVSYMWCAEIAAVSCCYCRSRFAGWPRPQQPNPQSRKENGNCCAFSSHDFDDPKLETTLPPRNT